MASALGQCRPASAAGRLLLSWFAVCTVQILLYGLPLLTKKLQSPDDYMHLSRVKDLINNSGGQPWHEPRIGIHGADILWSPLIDRSLQGLALLWQNFTGQGQEQALYAAATIMPLLLTLPFLAAATAYAGKLAGWRPLLLGAVFIFLFMPMAYMFSPGAIDHHAWQLVLQATALACLVRATDKATVNPALYASAAGLCMAAGLAVGWEAIIWLPLVMIIPGMTWLLQKEPDRKALAAFALSLLAGSLALFVTTNPPSRWMLAVCDGFSLISLAAAGVAAFFWGGLALVPHTLTTTRRRRFNCAALLGLPLITIFLVRFPECITNPYDMNGPALEQAWLRYMDEVQNAGAFFLSHWQSALLIYLPLLAAPCICLWVLRREKPANPILWASLGTASACSFAIALIQIRFSTFAAVIALAAWLWLAVNLPRLIKQLYAAYKTLPPRTRTLIDFTPLVAGLSCFAVGIWLNTALPPRQPPITGNCDERFAAQTLNRLPEPVTIAAMVTSGPELLFRTDHRVLSAPYHRNENGILTAYRILSATDEHAAYKLVQDSGTSIVLICTPHLPFWQAAAQNGSSLAAKLIHGAPPSWLKLLAQNPDGHYKIYQVQEK